MCKETHLPFAVLAIFASFGSIPSRVQPALKNTVRKLACIAAAATTASAAILRTDGTGIMVPSGVTPASLLAGVSKRAVRPVMAAGAGAPPDLELVHAEVVRGIRVRIIIIIGVHHHVVVGKVLLEKGLLGEQVGGAVVCGGCAASEELPWWDVNVPKRFLERDELVGGLKLVLLCTHTTHFLGYGMGTLCFCEILKVRKKVLCENGETRDALYRMVCEI